MAKGGRRKLSTKIIAFCVVFTTILSIVIGWLGYNTYSKNVIERYQVYVNSLIKISASKINGDDIRSCIDTLHKSEDFQKMQNGLNTVKENAEVEFVYMVYFPNNQDHHHMGYVLNAYTKEELLKEAATVHSLGDPCGEGDFDDNMINLFYNSLYDNSNKTQTRFVNNTSEYGYIMTAYLPIMDSQGKGVCVLAMDISMNQIHENMRSYLITVALGTLILLVVFLLVFITIMKRSVITPIKSIAESAQNFVKQSYETEDPAQLSFREISVGTKDEIELLASSLNHMTSEIKNYMINLAGMSAEKERLGAELDVANQIQSNMFPTVFPAFPNRPEFDIYAIRTSVAGDGNFYDFFLVDENHLCIVAGKASGKGIPAMLFAVLAAANIRSFARLGYQPYRIAMETNNQLSQNNTEGLTVSVFVGVLDIKTGEMDYINAGQPTTIVKRAGTSFEEVSEVKSFVLANMENVNFSQNHIDFMQGDVMMLYTSGVSDTKNEHGDEFSEAHVSIQLNMILKHEYELDKILAAMNSSLNEFKNGSKDTSSGIMLMFRFFG
jgi:Serine phosphatase RsbU, regulator of sigma subunit